jgi:hypothetical protein
MDKPAIFLLWPADSPCFAILRQKTSPLHRLSGAVLAPNADHRLFVFEERGTAVRDFGAIVTEILFAKLAAPPDFTSSTVPI